MFCYKAGWTGSSRSAAKRYRRDGVDCFFFLASGLRPGTSEDGFSPGINGYELILKRGVSATFRVTDR